MNDHEYQNDTEVLDNREPMCVDKNEAEETSNRPELIVFTSDNSTSERINVFKTFTNGMFTDEFVQILTNMGYFTVPATIRQRGNYKGGLFDHSFLVAQILSRLTIDNHLPWAINRSPVLIGLMHDICSCEDYKFDDHGSFIWNDDQLIDGHGDKSVMILSQFMTLSSEEMMCIRYHTGIEPDRCHNPAFQDCYDKATKRFQMILWTQLADRIATQTYNC